MDDPDFLSDEEEKAAIDQQMMVNPNKLHNLSITHYDLLDFGMTIIIFDHKSY